MSSLVVVTLAALQLRGLIDSNCRLRGAGQSLAHEAQDRKRHLISCLRSRNSYITQYNINLTDMQSSQLRSFAVEYNLRIDDTLVKHLLAIGMATVREKVKDISNSSVKQLAKSYRKESGEERIRNELEKIKAELGKLSKHFDSKPECEDSKSMLKTVSDISSQEQLRWWSSPQQPPRHAEYLPPRANKNRKDSLTPKVTESPAPPLQVQKVSYKHHLDDSEIKKTLWDNRTTDPSESVCSSSFHHNPRQLSPSFKEELPRRQLQPPKADKENIKPQQGSARKVSHHQQSQQQPLHQTSQQTKQPRKSNKRKCWSISKKESNNHSLKNVQSKIKDQIDYDRQAYRHRLLQAQLQQEDTIHTLHTESEAEVEPCVKQPTYTTFQMNSTQTENYSNRNPIISINTKPQTTTEDALQYTMNRPLQLENPNETAHIRYISSITSRNSQETTPANTQYRDLYSQAMTAQSVFLQSDLSNNDRKVGSSGKGRFRSEMRSEVVSGRDALSKLTSERKHLSQQLTQKPPSEGEEHALQRRLREILSQHDYHSSISSNFSLFNPKDEFKSFFQHEFTSDRKFLTGRHGNINDDNSSNISFNTDSRGKNHQRIEQLQ